MATVSSQSSRLGFRDQAQLRRLLQAQALQQPLKEPIQAQSQGLAHLANVLSGSLEERQIMQESKAADAAAAQRRQAFARQLAAHYGVTLPDAPQPAPEQPGMLGRAANWLGRQFGGSETPQAPEPLAGAPAGMPPVISPTTPEGPQPPVQGPGAGSGLPVPPQPPGAPTGGPAQPQGGQNPALIAMLLQGIQDPETAGVAGAMAPLLMREPRQNPLVEGTGPQGYGQYERMPDGSLRFVIATRQPGSGGGNAANPALHGSPQWAQNAQGQWVLVAPDRSGGLRVLPTPEGITLMPPTRSVDTGTSTVPVGPGGAPVGQAIPRDNAGAAAGREIGEAAGQSAASAPAAIATGDRLLAQVDDIARHPALGSTTGALSWTGIIPGTPMADFKARVDQLAGGAFLEAFNTLKGGGQITEAEGRKATEALARLNRAVSPADFRRALADFREVIETGRQRAVGALERGRAVTQGSAVQLPGAAPGTTASPPPPAAPRLRYNPATGRIE